MNGPNDPTFGPRWGLRWGRACRGWGLGVLGLLMAVGGHAAIQFDVFVGYGSGGGGDGWVREAGWFPVACEVYNDGPGFDATVEFSSRQMGGGQARRMAIELPTKTRKRFSFPVFSGASRFASWDARLYDSRGRLRAERLDLRCRDLAWEGILLGGLPRSFNGLPSFPPISGGRSESQPQVARMTVEQFPDSPIGLEGLTALYLNSEKALSLEASQIAALQAWVHGGGHLIVAPEQAQDIASTPWLRGLFPCELSGITTNRSRGLLHAWLQGGPSVRGMDETAPASVPIVFPRSRTAVRPGRLPSAGDGNPYARLQEDRDFENTDFPVFTSKPRDGATSVALGSIPLAVTAPRGRGQITALTFSPEREPFRSWKHRGWFWARLLSVPGSLFEPAAQNPTFYGGASVDGVIGAMIESRQVRKLPVEWLLVLLAVYLAVIGPFDHWFLKRINRQMLTWVTFPAYVLLFSLLIYYIGYKLRAGESEWNELHLVDILPRNEKAELRGRTFASLYSSLNAKYRLASEQPCATLRSEFLGSWGGSQDSSRVDVDLKPKGFQAEVSVPVWTSLLYVSDWQQPSALPLEVSWTKEGTQNKVTVQNRLAHPLPEVRWVWQGRIYDLGKLGPNETKTFTLETTKAAELAQFVQATSVHFQQAANSRRQAFGRDVQSRLELTPANLMAASFIGQAALQRPGQRDFLYPSGFDLSALIERGDAVLLAWDAGHSLASTPLRRFTPPRTTQNSLLRLALTPPRPGA